MLGKQWLAVALVALTAAFGLTASSASAAKHLKADLGTGIGSVLPARGDKTEISLSCPFRERGKCRGSVTLVPRGRTEDEIGKGAVASEEFKLEAGEDKDLRVRLDGDASGELKDGGLYVDVELRQAGKAKPIETKRMVANHSELYTPKHQKPTLVRSRDNQDTFSWSFNIPKGKALVMKKWNCPGDTPYLFHGPHRREIPGRPVDIVVTDAHLDARASAGTGYAGFDQSNTALWKAAFNNFRNMTGWKEGGFWSNSIWAPLGDDGHFELRVICTDERGLTAARLYDYGDDSSTYRDFFPWKW